MAKKDEAPKATASTEEPTFTAAELIAAAEQVFGVRPELMAGALYGLKDPITRAEARKRLDAFLNKEVSK